MATTITANGINFPDGSAGSPSIGGTDTNTGLFTGSDIVGFATGGSERLRIDASGDINIANDSGKLQLGTGADLQLLHDGSRSSINNRTGELRLSAADNIRLGYASAGNTTSITENYAVFKLNGAVELFYDNSKKIETTSAGATVTGALTVDNAGGNAILGQNLSLVDNGKVKLGTSDDLQIYHDAGAASHINATGLLNIDGTTGVRLEHNNATRLETTSTGISVTGQVAATTDFKGLDNVALTLGTSSDLRILHDGTDNVITSDGGQSIRLVNHLTGGNESMIKCIPNGATELYHNGSKKFETTSTGVDISGNLDLSGYVENHFAPSADNTYDLGFSSYRWRNVYTNDLNLSNEGGSNDVDGTWGSYTIQEGEESLFLINKRNGKKYKFNLTEVS